MQTPRRSGADLVEAARRLNHHTLALLPGAVLLVGFQLYALPRALPHLDSIGSVVVVAATLWSMAGAMALLSLYSHVRLGFSAADQQSIEAIRLRLAGTTSALLVGATSDIALAVAVSTGSWSPATVVAGVLVVIICMICW